MKIIKFTTKIVQIPLKTPFITALRHVTHVETVRLFVHTDTGHIGIGEAPPTKAITGEDTQDIIDIINTKIAPKLLHQDINEINIFDRLHHSCEHHSSAKAAVDIALYDLLSKEQGLAHYLGAKSISVQTDVTISLNQPQIMLQETKKAIAAGFSILKVKVGGKDGKDLQRIQTICEAAPKSTILIDVNQAWTLREATTILKSLNYTNIALVEQPLDADDITGMQTLTQANYFPILADESAFNLKEVRHIVEHKAAHMINIKLMKCGGIYKALEIIHYCKRAKIPCMMGSMLEGPYSIRAAMTLVLAYPELFLYCDLDSPQLYKTLPFDAPLSMKIDTLTLI